VRRNIVDKYESTTGRLKQYRRAIR